MTTVLKYSGHEQAAGLHVTVSQERMWGDAFFFTVLRQDSSEKAN
jgi:hypothetical protein